MVEVVDRDAPRPPPPALGPAGCAETARAAEEVVSLPMYPELTEEQVERICGALRNLAE